MARRRALVLETDLLVAERTQRLLAAEDFAVCHTAVPELAFELAASLDMDLYVAGVSDEPGAETPGLLATRAPLVLLAPLERRAVATHLRVAYPDAILVDRALRDPESLRRALPPRTEAPEPAPVDGVRLAFETFGLSERQLEVLGRALLGDPSAEIARRLFISQATVRNHLHAIYERVGVSGRRELLGRCVRGLLEGNALIRPIPPMRPIGPTGA